MTTLQQFVERAAQVSFQAQLTAETTNYFSGLVQSTLRLTANLTAEERDIVTREFPCPIIFEAPKHPEVRPHPALAAIRDGMRKVLHGLLKRTSDLKTLHIGAAHREIKNGMFQRNSHFSLFGTEPKDDNRTQVAMLNDLATMLRKAQDNDEDFANFPVAVPLDSKDLCDLFCEAHGITDRVGWNLENSGQSYNRLIYEDSHYNKTALDFYNDFKNTGASVGYVIGLLPPELVEEQGPINELYRVTRSGDNVRFTDVRGFANGYIHKLEAWSTLIQAPAYAGKDFNLVFEIVCRAGPFVIIEIARTYNGGPVTRDLTLYRQAYVKVVNLGYYNEKPKTMAQLALNRIVDFEQYFIMSEEEYHSVYGFVSGLAELSIQLPAVNNFIRKRSGGAALIDKIFTKKWQLETEHYSLLSAVIIMRVLRDREMLEDAKGTVRSEGLLMRTWRRLLSFNVPEWFVNLCHTTDILQKCVVKYDPVLEQTVELPNHLGKHTFLLESSKPNLPTLEPANLKTCRTCALFPWLDEKDESDEQVMVCGKDMQSINFSMDQDELDKFRETLLPEDTDADTLKKVKEAARNALPKGGFEFRCDVAIIEGAFGTGKSFQAKKLVTQDDAVLAPFRKLMTDYERDSTGAKIHFKTMHRAISDSKRTRYMMVDECGSFPGEYLKACAFLYQPDVVILFGDMKQTKTTAAEGTCLDRFINFNNAHYLRKNFRNSTQVIDWACKKFGYDMIPAGPKYNSDAPLVTFHKEDWVIPDDMPHISPDRGLVNLDITSATIRQYQGQTVKELCISITPEGLGTFMVPCIKLVGLTRSKGTTHIRLMESASKDSVMGAIMLREYVEFKPRLQKESQHLKDTRFIIAIKKYMSAKMQLALAKQAGVDATQLDHKGNPVVPLPVPKTLAKRKKKKSKPLPKPFFPSVEMTTSWQKSQVRTYFDTLRYRHIPSPELTQFCVNLGAVTIQYGIPIRIKQWIDWYNVPEPEGMVALEPVVEAPKLPVDAETLRTMREIAELNREQQRISKEYWSTTNPADYQSRFDEIDYEMVLGRKLCPEAEAFLVRVPRSRPTVVPVTGKFTIVDDDDDDEDFDVSIDLPNHGLQSLGAIKKPEPVHQI